MRLELGPGALPASRQYCLCGWRRVAVIGLLLPWLATCHYTFLAGRSDGGPDGGPDGGVDSEVDGEVDSDLDSGPDPDGQVDVGIDAAPGDCGNGIVGPGEECDDGNLTDGDGCDHACQVECCNGSAVDCNYSTYGTVNPSAAFVDPDPPAGFCQCGGFENTPGHDVDYNWEGHCLGLATVLRIRYWDTSTNPWTLLGDATLSPMSLAGFATQTFDASNHGGTEGVLESQGLTLLKDDPSSPVYGHQTCFEPGPTGYQYQFNDMYFANQTNDKVVWVCSASDADRCDPDHELRMGDTSFGTCVSPPHHYDLAIAVYRQIP